jgi:SAM-dependent methyltransferase
MAKTMFDDPRAFAREDETADTGFYSFPRLVLHVDEQTSRALVAWFAANLPAGGDILDLMSAWASHLPAAPRYRTVVGLGMNAVELRENPALTGGLIADINARPALPFRDAAFDACLISFSIQYLVRPVEVFAEIGRVLKPGGVLHVAYSHRLFPTKAIALWQAASNGEHARIIARYVQAAGNLGQPRFECPLERSSGFDPLYIVSATKG